MFNFINQIFNGQDSNNYITLLDIVPKQYDQDEGIFANINNDMADINFLDYPINVQMSYAYARRTAAAGLFLQGVFTEDDYSHAALMFKNFQIMTYTHLDNDKRNVNFQEKCARESDEFMMSYDSRLNRELCITITSIVELSKDRNTIPKISDYNMLISHIQYTMKQSFINSKDDLMIIKILVEGIYQNIEKKIYSKELAEKFVLEELDAASKGDSYAKAFVKNSGVDESKYKGSMLRYDENVDEDEVEELELLFRSFIFKIDNSINRTIISLKVVDKIMQRWEIGKYSR